MMVITGIISQQQALVHLGQPSLLRIIFLLIVSVATSPHVLSSHPFFPKSRLVSHITAPLSPLRITLGRV